MRRYRETERMEQDRLKRIRDKEDKLADWIRKKEEDMKGEGYVAIKQLKFQWLSCNTLL